MVTKTKIKVNEKAGFDKPAFFGLIFI